MDGFFDNISTIEYDRQHRISQDIITLLIFLSSFYSAMVGCIFSRPTKMMIQDTNLYSTRSDGLSYQVQKKPKEFCRAMFCLLTVLIYLCLLVCIKWFLCSCPVERGKDIILYFLYFNSKLCERLPKKLPIGKKSQKFKNILSNCHIELKKCY